MHIIIISSKRLISVQFQRVYFVLVNLLAKRIFIQLNTQQ